MPYRPTEHEIQLIKDAYKNHKWAVKYLKKNCPEFKDISRDTLRYAAKKLGLLRPKRKWTEEEKEIVEKYISDKSVKDIIATLKRKGYTRSCEAIRQYANKIIRRSTKPDLYNVEDICIGLGCTRRQVYNWIDTKKLRIKDKKRNWEIKPKDLARFILSYPQELDGSIPDAVWLVLLIKELMFSLNGKYKEKLLNNGNSELD